jgi:hypothetical protein
MTTLLNSTVVISTLAMAATMRMVWVVFMAFSFGGGLLR